MRSHALLFLMTVMGLSILVTGCGSSDRFDRAAAVARIEARLSQHSAWSAQYAPLSERRKAGEDVATEIETMKSSRPGFADLVEDAERVVQADPTDDAAFKAIEVALRGNGIEDMSRWKGSVNEARQQRMQQALLAYHTQRPEFLRATFVSFPDPQPQIEFWKQVLESSPHASVRALAARSVMKRYAEWAQASDVNPEQRETLRAQARHYAVLIKTRYAEETTVVRQADAFLAALDHSAGAVLPDVEVAKVSGGVDALANYRGKVVLLDVWASWCGPCRRDHPKLRALKQELRGPFEIISVSADEKPEMVTQYMARHGNLPWPQWYVGAEGALLKQWGIQGYPTYLLVDPDGKLEARATTQSLDELMEQAHGLVAQIQGR